MKKFLAIILTLCALTCSAFAFTACGDGGYEQGPNATARPNVTTVADEAEWKRLLSLSDSYPCTLTQSGIYTSIYDYNGTVMKGTYSTSSSTEVIYIFIEKVGDVYYQYSQNKHGIYVKELIETSDLGLNFSPINTTMNVCESLFTYSDFTYNESTSRYENDENYVKFVDGRFSEAYYSEYETTFKVTYGKVDITLPQV